MNVICATYGQNGILLPIWISYHYLDPVKAYVLTSVRIAIYQKFPQSLSACLILFGLKGECTLKPRSSLPISRTSGTAGNFPCRFLPGCVGSMIYPQYINMNGLDRLAHIAKTLGLFLIAFRFDMTISYWCQTDVDPSVVPFCVASYNTRTAVVCGFILAISKHITVTSTAS